MEFIALDLELNQPSRKIIEVGICIGSPETRPDTWHTQGWYLDPEEPIAPFITELTGISDSTIATQSVPWETMASQLTALLSQRSTFVNPVTWGGGDAEALKSSLDERQLTFPFFGRRWVDVKTIHVADQLALGRSPHGGLSSVMRAYGLTFQGQAHRASADAKNTLLLFCEILRRRKDTYEAVVKLKGAYK